MEINKLPKKTFCFGTQYYRMVPMPEDWKRDIARIKKMGMDTIRFWALWKWAEPVPGKFYFEDLHALIRLAREQGLDVILVIEMDKVPGWVRESVAGHQLRNLDGTPDQNPWAYVNWDHPGIRKLGERFLVEVCRQFGQYDNIIYDVWNEPDKPEDSGTVSRRKFFDWLRPRFDSLEAMIEKLRLPKYESWDQVPMPASTWDTQLYLLYQEFRTWSIAEQVRWAYEIVKAQLPHAPVTVHVHCDEHPFTFRWFGNVSDVGWDDWEMHKQVDFYIAAKHEFYQGEGAYAKLENIAAPVADLETKRSITGGQYWTTGLAGGASKLGGGLLTGIEPKENLFSLWMCVAHEAKGVVYWQYRIERLLGPEAPGWGLAAFDGGETFRTRECETFITALRPHESALMRASLSPPETAVLYSLKSHIMNETQPHLNYIMAFEGACLTFYLNNIAFQVVSEKDSFEGLHTIYVPMAQCLEDQTIERLLKFVRRGGILVIEAATGAYDESGLLNTAIPAGETFVNACGVREKDILYADEFVFESQNGPVRGLKERRIIETSGGTDVIGYWPDGQPAATHSEYGDGEVLYFGTNVSWATRQPGGAQQAKVVADLIGVTSDVVVEPYGAITCRILENDSEHVVFIFNHSKAKSKACITLPFPAVNYKIVFQSDSFFDAEGSSLHAEMEHREVIVLRVPK